MSIVAKGRLGIVTSRRGKWTASLLTVLLLGAATQAKPVSLTTPEKAWSFNNGAEFPAPPER